MVFQDKPITGIILAAGKASRFAGLKQCADIGNGSTLLAHVVTQALNSNLDDVLLVLGYKRSEILKSLVDLLDNNRLTVVENDAFETGMSSSLRAGLKTVHESAAAVMFILGDQPMVTTELMNDLVSEYKRSNAPLCVPMIKTDESAQRPGNPVIIGQRLFPEILEITGDIGARELVKKYLSQARLVGLDNDITQFQINTQDDLRKFRGDI